MRVYEPDAWVILRIDDQHGEIVHKVMGGWYGGYLNPNSWRLNSGIILIERDDDHYRIYGQSGSVYYVHKDTQRTSMLMSSVIEQLRDSTLVDIQIVDIAEVL